MDRCSVSAFRYSGAIRIRVTYKDPKPAHVFRDGTPRHPNGYYVCTLREFETAKEGFGTVKARKIVIVGAPAFLPRGQAVDSPEAFDSAARAALAFAYDDDSSWGDHAASDDSGYHLGRNPEDAWPQEKGPEVSILSIDAWNSPEGWTWNNWHKVGSVDVSICNRSHRAILAFMRREGYLGAGSIGRVAIEDDQYNVVIVAKGTREPLFAIAYGEAEYPSPPIVADPFIAHDQPEAKGSVRS